MQDRLVSFDEWAFHGACLGIVTILACGLAGSMEASWGCLTFCGGIAMFCSGSLLACYLFVSAVTPALQGKSGGDPRVQNARQQEQGRPVQKLKRRRE